MRVNFDANRAYRDSRWDDNYHVIRKNVGVTPDKNKYYYTECGCCKTTYGLTKPEWIKEDHPLEWTCKRQLRYVDLKGFNGKNAEIRNGVFLRCNQFNVAGVNTVRFDYDGVLVDGDEERVREARKASEHNWQDLYMKSYLKMHPEEKDKLAPWENPNFAGYHTGAISFK
jgi:hypothetical protein